MSRRAQENVIAGILVGVFAVYLLLTLGLGPNARLVPVPIALMGLAFLLIQIVNQNLRGGREFNLDLFASLTAGVASSPSRESKQVETPTAFGRELQALGFLAAFIVLILLLGPIFAVFIFTTGYFVVTRHFAPLKAVAVASLCVLALYLLFAVGLQLQLYHGLLEPLFESQ